MHKKLRAIVTSGPTREQIDPVRYISNYSSGIQGHAIASALAIKGVDVTLISGSVSLPDPENVKVIKVETAQQMLKECESSLPVDIVICAAAVSDWQPEITRDQKMKKEDGVNKIAIDFVKNPDILATISQHPTLRPKLVVGFAAETENLIENATAKLHKKGCDWILVNNVSQDVFGNDDNQICLITSDGIERWERMSKANVADKLTMKINAFFDSYSKGMLSN